LGQKCTGVLPLRTYRTSQRQSGPPHGWLEVAAPAQPDCGSQASIQAAGVGKRGGRTCGWTKTV